LGRGVLPVNERGRNRGRISVFRSFLVSTSALAAVVIFAAGPGAAQTVTPQDEAAKDVKDKGKLPQIQVHAPPPKPRSGRRRLATPSTGPSPSNATPSSATPAPPAVGNGAPATPLNTNVVASSASRLGLTVFQTPATVEVVNQQTMQEQGYRTTTETAQGAVGVLSGDAGGAPANFSMRGFSFSEVNVLYNGIWTGPSDITARWMDTANLEQVEFLKGPSSLMSGMNALGGSVNYVTRQPTTGPIQNEAEVSLDSYGSVRSHLGSGGSTLVPGLDYRFDLTGSQLNSFIEGDYRDLTDLSGQLNYHLTNNFMVFGAIEYKKDSGHAYWGTPLVPTSFAGSHAISGVVSGTAVSEFDGSIIGPVTIDSRTLTTNYNVTDNATGAQELWLRTGFEWTPLNNITIKNQVYSWQAKANWIDSETYAFDNATSMIAQDRFAVSHDQKLIGDNTDFTWDSRLFGMDNRFAAQLQISRNWITFTEDNEGAFPDATEISVVDPVQQPYGPIDFDTRISRLTDIAGSFEDRLKITSAFTLIGGVRLEDLTLDRSGVDFDGTIDPEPFTKTWLPVSYRAAYTYEPIPNLMFYSMYATAYDPAVAAVFSISPGTSLNLTSSKTYETGAKQLFWDGRAEWTLSLYDIIQRNVFVQINDVDSAVAGEVATKGIEMAGAVRPIDGLKLWGNVALTHARFAEFDDPGVGSFTGNAPPNVAPIIVNGGASYRFDHWRWPVEFGGSVRHVGDRFVFDDDATTMRAYTTADVYAFVDIPGEDVAMPEFKDLRLTFRVRNLTNAVYAQWSDPGLADQILLGAPRTYEVAASAKW
jgi:iron complex outermembrane recepter protein